MSQRAPGSALAILPQLESVVPYWQQWSVALATAIGRNASDSAAVELASQWLQAKLDLVLQSQIQSLQWMQIPAATQQNIINAYVNDLRSRNML